jgi:hypothetical protein
MSGHRPASKTAAIPPARAALALWWATAAITPPMASPGRGEKVGLEGSGWLHLAVSTHGRWPGAPTMKDQSQPRDRWAARRLVARPCRNIRLAGRFIRP